MKKIVSAAMLSLAATASGANTTTNYAYDALGRLKTVEARGTGGLGSQSAYSYDQASNRQTVQSSGAFKGPTITAGNQLNAGQVLLSSDTRFKLVMQFNGDLALYDQSDSLLWHTGTTTGSFAAMQGDGNFVVYNSNNQAVWNSQTNGNGGSFLTVQIDGNAVVYTQQGQAVWNSQTCCH